MIALPLATRKARYIMIFLSALVLSGAIVYLANQNAGALLIAAGCAAAVLKWLAGLPAWQSKPTARPDVSTETRQAAPGGPPAPTA